MSQDNVTYAIVAAVAADGAWNWTRLIPDPTLQNLMYAVTIGWILYQAWCKWKGKDK